MSVRLGFRPCSHCLRRYARQAAGFTLIEMMVTVAIVAVLAVLAAPSYTEFLIRNRSASISNEFTSSVLRARSTAVTRNACVTMCRADASATTAACAPTGGWTGGWITFTNPNCDATLDAPAAADDLIGSAGPFDTSFSMVSNAANTGKLMFSPSGSPRPGDAGRFDLQYLTTGSTRTSNRGICLSSLGRTHLVAYGGTCP